jgi:hypothetical protein
MIRCSASFILLALRWIYCAAGVGSVPEVKTVAISDYAALQTHGQSDVHRVKVQRLMRAHDAHIGATNEDAFTSSDGVGNSLLQTGSALEVHASILNIRRSALRVKSDHAIVSHFCTDDWAPGVLALAGSLRRFPLESDLVVMIPTNVSEPIRHALSLVFDRVYIEEPIIPHPAVDRLHGDCLTLQLRAWQLPYKKVLYMDADMIAIANPEPLLHQYGELTAQADDRNEFNGGMFICEPNPATFSVMEQKLRTYRRQKGKRGGIQPFMNFAFPQCNETGDPQTFGHAGCWRNRLNKYHNRFSRLLNETDVERLLQGDTTLYGTIHFSGDWQRAVKPWMRGCMAMKELVHLHECLVWASTTSLRSRHTSFQNGKYT